jgi:hypothetical protein
MQGIFDAEKAILSGSPQGNLLARLGAGLNKSPKPMQIARKFTSRKACTYLSLLTCQKANADEMKNSDSVLRQEWQNS